MQTTYAKRLKRARTHAGISQAELARRIGPKGIKPQAIQYLEDENNNAQGSRYTAEIAKQCGVDAAWLGSGAGDMLGKNVQQPAAEYSLHTAPALAKMIRSLRPELRQALGILLSAISDDRARIVSMSAGEAAGARPATTSRLSDKKVRTA